MEQIEIAGSRPDTAEAPQPLRPRKPWWRGLLKWVLILAASMTGLFVLLGCVVWLILTPPRLTPIVNDLATRYLNATVHFDTVRLSLFSDFPRVSLQLKNGEVISGVFSRVPDSLRHAVPVQADSLLSFGELSVSVNLLRLLASQIVVRQVKLVDPHIYAYVSPAGNPNWAIYTPSEPSADTTATDLSTLFGIRVHELVLEGGHITYDSRPDHVLATLDPIDLRLTGHRRQRYEIDFGSEVSLRQGRLGFCDTLPLSLKGGFQFDTEHPGGIELDKLTLGVGGIPAVFDGRVMIASDSIRSDMSCRVNPLRFARVLAVVPPQLLPVARKLETNLSADLDTRITGTYRFTGNVLPSVRLDCKVGGGYLGVGGTRARIDNLSLDATLWYHPQRPDSTGVVLRSLAVDGIGMKFRAEGSAWDALRDPRIRAKMKGSINLGTLTELFPAKRTGLVAYGVVGIDADVAGRLSQFTPRGVGQARVHAALTLNGLLVDMPQDTLRLMADGTRINFGANPNLPEQDTIIAAGTQVVYLEVQADTLQMNLKETMEVTVAGASIRMRNAASVLSGDTTVVHPFTGSAESRYMKIDGLDSMWVRAQDASTRFSIMPSPSNPQIPVIRLRIGSMGLAARSQENSYVLNGSDVNIEATITTTRREQALRREHRLDSLQRLYPGVPRDSLQAHNLAVRRLSGGAAKRAKDDFAGEDIDIKVDRSIGNLLRRWNAKGTISAISGRVVTPYFPLNNMLKNVDLSFTTDRVDLRGTTIRTGVSDLSLTGRVANIRRALLGRGNLEVEMKIESDTLDVNELVKAAGTGAAYATSSQSYKDSLREATSGEHIQQMIDQKAQADTASQSSLIVIPGNVVMDVDLDVHYGIYADLVLNRLSGCLVVRDRCLQLNDLAAVTDAGEMTLTALYATRSRTDLTTGFDLELKRMQMARLIKLIPSVDTLLPMLRSFEGIVDCQIAATAALDTSMNILLPTLNAACRIHGENLVLLDGETFTEISKMLRFKNRKRNMINSISVELLVRDNQVEVFPFVIEMDRYRAAVSGVQKLDMSFNYHISVLKSPIPFRLGVDIFGTPDKFKFRIGRARYKSADVPTYVELIDSTRVNLRRRITDIFKKGVQAATLSDLTITPKTEIPSEVAAQTEALTAADSLLLREQGVLPADTTASADTLQPGSLSAAPATTKAGPGAEAAPGTEAGGEAPVADEALPASDPRKARREAKRQQAILRKEQKKVAPEAADQ